MAINKKQSQSRSSTGTKIDFMKAANNVGQPIAAVLGFAAGKYAINKLQSSTAVSGLMGIDTKELFIPAAVCIGGLLGTQITSNKYVQLGLIGIAGSGIESGITKLTGKTLFSGFEGLMGETESDSYKMAQYTQSLPAADINIDREIQKSIQGVSDFMSDEPVGNAAEFMSDEPVGSAAEFMSDEPVGNTSEYLENISMAKDDSDIFAGDMMAT